MAAIWLHIAALIIVLTAGLHSILGERRLIRPLVERRDGVMASTVARRVLRYAWHFTSVLMVLSAAGLIVAAAHPGHGLDILVALTGATYLAVGLLDGALTRLRHVGWLPLTLAGVTTLLAVL